MKQFLLRENPLPDGIVILSGKDYHYLARVRRVKAGDTLRAALPGGMLAQLQIESIDKERLVCRLHAESTDRPQPGGPSIIVFQALAKPAKMDAVIRQAAEGGVCEIVPFVGRYSEQPAHGGAKLERWRRIVREARQQSGSPVETTVRSVQDTLDGALAYYREMRRAFAHTAAFVMSEKPADAENSLHRGLASRPGLICVAVGPEGGFSGAEMAAFIENGFIMINMGMNVLRVETACAWALGSVLMILREIEWWKLKE
jgi:16S rRNA (uracil1498-N3)-methyltransferase